MNANVLRSGARTLLDFVLPPRCPGCGLIVDDLHAFCSDCWRGIEFLGASGCIRCGLPLSATDADICAACLATPPRLTRIRAAVAYDELSRGLAIRLKYGRKVAVARTMAKYMAPLVQPSSSETVLVPVPLHRSRLWARGFNQSALVAQEIARTLGLKADPWLLRRKKRTPPLKGMTPAQRRSTVAGAFSLRGGKSLKGSRIILVDDVFTTGSTADACARVLFRGGASAVELISWARVVTPAQLMR